MKKWPSICKKSSYSGSEIPNYWLSQKVWLSGFPSVNGNGKFVLIIIKKIKKWNIVIQWNVKFQINEMQSLRLGIWLFLVSMETENWYWLLWKMGKLPPFCKKFSKVPNYTNHPLTLGLGFFLVPTEMESWCWLLWKNRKIAANSRTFSMQQNSKLLTTSNF